MTTNILTLLAEGFETERFPVDECSHPYPKEEGILYSKDLYVCVLLNKKWPKSLRIQILSPYTCKSGKRLLYGWSDIDGNVYDHITKSIHGDGERVVAWKKVPTGFKGFTVKRIPKKGDRKCVEQSPPR